jgi:hypothetical protein
MQEVQLDIAPKKPNWDLKRDISKKLEKLERRTQGAIVKLIKQKLAEVGIINLFLLCIFDKHAAVCVLREVMHSGSHMPFFCYILSLLSHNVSSCIAVR